MGLFSLFSKTLSGGPIYSVMNEDHVHLYRTLKELKDCLGIPCRDNAERVRQRAAVLDIFQALIAESREHFRREEALMELFKYPDLKTHRSEHTMLARSVEMYLSRLTQGMNAIDSTVAVYLKSWLTNHIRTTDRELERFLVRTSKSLGSPDMATLAPTGHNSQGAFAFLWATLRDSVPRRTVEEQRKRAHNKAEQVNKWKERYRQKPDEDSRIRESIDEKARQQRAVFYE